MIKPTTQKCCLHGRECKPESLHWNLSNYYGVSGTFCQYHYDLVSHDSYGKPNNPDAYMRIKELLRPRENLINYSVIYAEKTGEPIFSNQLLVFTCQAEDGSHAREQCLDAYPDCSVLSVSSGVPEDHLHSFKLVQEDLPTWAVTHNYAFDIFPGVQLCTKDGRRVGNAYIIQKGSIEDRWTILTDAGSKILNLTRSELADMFYLGKFVGRLEEILKRFSKPC